LRNQKAGKVVESVTPAGSCAAGKKQSSTLICWSRLPMGHFAEARDALAKHILEFVRHDQTLAQRENISQLHAGNRLTVDVSPLLDKRKSALRCAICTGSKEHNVAFARPRNDMGLTLNELRWPLER